MIDDNRIQFRAESGLLSWLADRQERVLDAASIHEQARTELEMWRTVLQLELRRIPLTVPEASCIADVLNGSLILGGGVPITVGRVFAELFDAFEIAKGISSYGNKWGIDEARLLDKLRAGPAADLALADAISRWWKQDGEATAEGFASVGIRVIGQAEEVSAR